MLPRGSSPPSPSFIAFALASFCTLASGSAFAQDVERGATLARALCGKCHFSARPGELTGRSGVPTFSSIAKRREQNFDGVVRWLRSVPDVMPDHHLSQDEILDLAAYIMSLKLTPD